MRTCQIAFGIRLSPTIQSSTPFWQPTGSRLYTTMFLITLQPVESILFSVLLNWCFWLAFYFEPEPVGSLLASDRPNSFDRAQPTGKPTRSRLRATAFLIMPRPENRSFLQFCRIGVFGSHCILNQNLSDHFWHPTDPTASTEHSQPANRLNPGSMQPRFFSYNAAAGESILSSVLLACCCLARFLFSNANLPDRFWHPAVPKLPNRAHLFGN